MLYNSFQESEQSGSEEKDFLNLFFSIYFYGSNPGPALQN